MTLTTRGPRVDEQNVFVGFGVDRAVKNTVKTRLGSVNMVVSLVGIEEEHVSTCFASRG